MSEIITNCHLLTRYIYLQLFEEDASTSPFYDVEQHLVHHEIHVGLPIPNPPPFPLHLLETTNYLTLHLELIQLTTQKFHQQLRQCRPLGREAARALDLPGDARAVANHRHSMYRRVERPQWRYLVVPGALVAWLVLEEGVAAVSLWVEVGGDGVTGGGVDVDVGEIERCPGWRRKDIQGGVFSLETVTQEQIGLQLLEGTMALVHWAEPVPTPTHPVCSDS